MNDLRSPLEDRPSYRQPPTTPSSSFGQRQYDAQPSYIGTKFNQFRQNKYFPLASVIAAVVVFGSIISYAYDQGSQTGVNATTPIVQASNDDYKSRPENPGGMDVPFQDAVVFDQLQSSETASNDKVESLLPAPEQPVAKTENATAETAAATTETTTATTETAAAEETKQAVQDSIKQASETTVPTQPEQSETAKTASIAANDEIAKKMDSVAPAATQPAAKIETGSYRVQLGAFRDETAAKAAWTKFKNQFNSQLAGVTPDFPRADLGAKGTFYRVQGTNLSKASADQICGSINAAKSGSCLVTK